MNLDQSSKKPIELRHYIPIEETSELLDVHHLLPLSKFYTKRLYPDDTIFPFFLSNKSPI